MKCARAQRGADETGVSIFWHAGHVRYLEGAKREGGVLGVGINSDGSVRQTERSGRPILPGTSASGNW